MSGLYVSDFQGQKEEEKETDNLKGADVGGEVLLLPFSQPHHALNLTFLCEGGGGGVAILFFFGIRLRKFALMISPFPLPKGSLKWA